MSSVSIIIAQYFAGAAGFSLTTDGALLQGDETLLQTTVERGRISAQDHYEILGLVARKVPDRAALSVRYAKSLDINKLGTLALACKAAPNLGGVLQRMARYHSLITNSVRYHLDPVGRSIFLRQDILAGSGHGLVFSPEAGLSAMYCAFDQVAAKKITPQSVTFQHQPPRDAHLFEELFGCEVKFGAAADGILFSQDSLTIENKLGDFALSEFLTKHLEAELEQLKAEPSLVRTTKEEIARVLSEGLPKMADVARSLGLSVRSFHRRLADHGSSFQTLAEETRRDIAMSMLRDETCALSEIAFLTGFSEQSAFNRAFKRWTKQTPANYRKSLSL
ncbi:AraC family transcriptional regulator ligand-binding domain-containing protein [Shimia sp.]|uniref:AraC family transcriptional regulator n=1 Tax=Shimia sp. TaxID=1954381 RepID=UPI003B8D4A62